MKVYSNDEEYFYEELEDVLTDVLDNTELVNGDEIIIYEGDQIDYKASDFLPYITETLMERAYEDAGEFSERWLFSNAMEGSLQKHMENALDEWADKNNAHPNFYKVDAVKKIKYVFKDGKLEESTQDKQEQENDK